MIRIEYSKAMESEAWKIKLNWLDKLILSICGKRLLANFDIVKGGYKASCQMRIRESRKRKEYYIHIYGIHEVEYY